MSSPPQVSSSIRHFIANTSEKREVKATISIPDAANKPVAVFDLYDGSIYKLDLRRQVRRRNRARGQST